MLLNKLLDDTQRSYYSESIQELKNFCPDTIKNKIEAANVQQAFILHTTKALIKQKENIGNCDILCVGAYEDTAAETLMKQGYNIVLIDPLDEIWNPRNCDHIIKADLHSYSKQFPSRKFDIVFSTSVIEHVEDDESFLANICEFLSDDGYGILTCDFNNDYVIGARKPVVDFRLYTKNDFIFRFMPILKKYNCVLIEPFSWDGIPDFDNGQAIYSFATFVFKKMVNK
jgi:2-polyprenyl-3-methyl-5-hydroxy-6-metoxy-1,4-benzoquinol methylase